MAVLEGEYDIIVLTETWLDDRIYSSQLFGEKYTVFRTDRSHLNSRKNRDGGVLIAVLRKYKCYVDPAPISDSLEQLWVIIEMPRFVTSVGVLYLPPDRKSDITLVQQHIDSLEFVLSRLCLHAHALMFCDYN